MTPMTLSAPGFDTLALRQSQPVKAPQSANAAKDEAVTKAAQEFEAVFISQMLSHMWQGVGVDDTFGGGHAEETWRGMLVEQYGKEIAKSGGFGMADHVKASLLQAQEMRGSQGVMR